MKPKPAAEKLNKENELKAKNLEAFKKDFDEFQSNSKQKYGLALVAKLTISEAGIMPQISYIEVKE